MSEYVYIMAVENYSEENDLFIENQKDLLFTGTEKLFIDLINSSQKESLNFLKMIECLKADDIVKITKLSILGPNIQDITRKYKLITQKNARIYIKNLDLLTNDKLSFETLIGVLSDINDDRLYFHRCVSLITSMKNRPKNIDKTPPGRPKKYTNKQLVDALKLKDRFTINEISQITGISKSSLQRASIKFEKI